MNELGDILRELGCDWTIWTLACEAGVADVLIFHGYLFILN